MTVGQDQDLARRELPVEGRSDDAPLTGWRRLAAIVVETILDWRDGLTTALWIDAKARRRTLVGAGSLLLIACLAGGWIWLQTLGGGAPRARPAAFSEIQPQAQLDPIAQEGLGFTLDASQLRAVSPEDARIINAGMPFTAEPSPAARPYFARLDLESYARALDCLTAAVYYEAGNETPQGQAAVAQVVLNRMRHPAYPNTVCGVVFQGSERATGCQFTFTCDGALATPPAADRWTRSRLIAGAALNGAVAAGVGWSTHYHADYVVPYWAAKLAKVRQIGAHIFYRWPGGVGKPAAFTNRPGPSEPFIAALASIAILPQEIFPLLQPDLTTVSMAPMLDSSAISLSMTDAAGPSHADMAHIAEDVAPTPPALVAARPVVMAPPPLLADPASAQASAAAPARTSRLAVPSGW